MTNLGFVLSQNGDLENAKSYFHRALDLNPESKEAANALVEIHRVIQQLTEEGAYLVPEGQRFAETPQPNSAHAEEQIVASVRDAAAVEEDTSVELSFRRQPAAGVQ